ncbi:hypothetical protein ACQP1V_11090 [Microtetraspora malaysiensis]|uniref:hypothetical protein n=1 Tax=Microtetraspora malaysiensis TaxID=161358 RepID=UPI003D8ADB9B
MLQVSLLDFLRGGRFGPIRLGATRAAIRDLLGEPHAVHIATRRVAYEDIWKYGDFEFYFDDSHDGADILWMIYTDEFTIPRCGSGVDVDPWLLRWDLPLAEATAALSGAGVGWDPHPAPPPDMDSIVTTGGVHLGFPHAEKGLQVINILLPR